ncbi:hypothetical protein [Streptomyces cacaoi]|uniref:hypothetical protein n=1 Tax=Streptomyces cacaoi TaxID=1898 RepID=UPI001CA7CA91|nr:hypothetical protein [Streptomyces cacaoi]
MNQDYGETGEPDETGTAAASRPADDRGPVQQAGNRSRPERADARGEPAEDTREEPAEGELLPTGDQPARDPDVLLDVPLLEVDEINFEVEDLRARVSLQAEVLDLLKLNVGADASLGRVQLEIKGVRAQALLKVRLDNVARIIDRVLRTIDHNPQILEQITSGVGSAVQEVGSGARHAVGELGRGAGEAVEDIGGGAGEAVQEVGKGAGEAVEDVGEGAGGAVHEVGSGAGTAVEEVGGGTGEAAGRIGAGAGEAVEDTGKGVGKAAGEVGEGAGSATEAAGKGAGKAAGAAGDTVRETGGAAASAAEDTVGKAGESAGAGGAGRAARKTVRKATRRKQEPP